MTCPGPVRASGRSAKARVGKPPLWGISPSLTSKSEASIPAQSLVFGREPQAGKIQVLRKIICSEQIRQGNPPVLTFEHCQLLLQIFFITELWVTEKFLKQEKKDIPKVKDAKENTLEGRYKCSITQKAYAIPREPHLSNSARRLENGLNPLHTLSLTFQCKGNASGVSDLSPTA